MYAVIGATGHTGKVVASELLTKGAPTRVIVRDAKKSRELARRGAEVIVADIHDRAALGRSLSGVRGLYAMLPPTLGPDMIADARRAAENIARAVREAKVPHVVQLSSIGAQHESLTGPIVTNHDLELALRPASEGHIALRAPYFMENWAEALSLLDEGKLITFVEPNQAIPMIATEDIGRIAARLLLEAPRGHAIVELEGPRAYAPADAASALSQLVGRPIEPLYVPNAQIVPMLTKLGVGGQTAELYREMYQAIAQGRAVHEGRGSVERGSVTLSTVLARTLQAVRFPERTS